MGLRVVHIIKNECEILIDKGKNDYITLRLMECPTEESCPSELADFQIEGSIPVLRNLFETLTTIMQHVGEMKEEIH